MMSNMQTNGFPGNPAAPVTATTSANWNMTTGGGATTAPTTVPAPASAATIVVPIQMGSMMNIVYNMMAVGKAVICLVFPIVVLVILQKKNIRAVL
jgi:hypothetical protein